MKFPPAVRCSLIAILFISCIKITIAGPTYTITDLGSLGNGTTGTRVNSINSCSQAVGVSYSYSSKQWHAFLYSGTTISDLGILLNGTKSEAYSINNSGLIVGDATTTSGVTHAFLYSNNIMTDLNSLINPTSGWVLNSARAINSIGQITGWGTINGATHAFRYKDGVVTDLGTLGGLDSNAYGINNDGLVVGVSRRADGVRRAFLYSNDAMTDLGALGNNNSDSYAYGINNNGQVTGWSVTAVVGSDGSQEKHAFLYSNGTMTDLGTLGGLHSYANGINNIGQVVGESHYDKTLTGPIYTRAFLYSGGKMTDLNSLIDPNSGWILRKALAINDSGQIVGYGYTGGSTTYHAFLLTPVQACGQ